MNVNISVVVKNEYSDWIYKDLSPTFIPYLIKYRGNHTSIKEEGVLSEVQKKNRTRGNDLRQETGEEMAKNDKVISPAKKIDRQ